MIRLHRVNDEQVTSQVLNIIFIRNDIGKIHLMAIAWSRAPGRALLLAAGSNQMLKLTTQTQSDSRLI